MNENSVLGFALDCLLKELGCIVVDNGNTTTISLGPRRLKLERRNDCWYDLEKNLWFYSRAQIASYIIRPTLGRL